MNGKHMLLEIGLEEMPARFIEDTRKQLGERVTEWLEEARLKFGEVHTYATPRRLAVLVEEVAERQEDQIEVVRGPAKQIAMDDQGQWTKAALGFARGQKVEVDQLFIDQHKGTEYLFARREEKGRAAVELLPELKNVIEKLSFPKYMRWGSYDFTFVRPIRWLVALYGDEVVPFQLAGVETDRVSQGHRFLGKSISISNSTDYVKQLSEQRVIVLPEERRKLILEQLTRLEKKQGWNIPIDQQLLDEVVHLVEYPRVVWGRFDEAYLQLPQEVLITSMREHQRYFPVVDDDGKLLPYFITVANGNEDREGLVARGNEKVLRARLADARFFYEEDRKLQIETALSRLEQIVFHKELGSIADKVRRLIALSRDLAEMLTLDEQVIVKIERAAQLSKFDLVTQMVNEFPELQGKMGEVYSRLAGEDDEVAQAIFEHYLPRYSGDSLPVTEVGAVVSLAEKLDTLAGFFGIGLIPSGSQDPYALRRLATGLVAIIIDRAWSLPINQLLELPLNLLEENNRLTDDKIKVKETLHDFILSRLRYRFQEENMRHDVSEAVLNSADDDLLAMAEKCKVLMRQINDEALKAKVEALVRVSNIAQQVKGAPGEVNESLFQHEAESVLYSQFTQVSVTLQKELTARQWDQALQTLFSLKEPIEQFFENVLVMVEEEDLRMNRLNLLAHIDQEIRRFADFGQLIFSNR